MIRDIKNSILSYFTALKLIKELRLYKYFFIPALLGLLIGIIIIGSAYSFSDNLGNVLTNLWPWDFGKSVMGIISRWISGFTILIFGILLYKHVLMAVSSPFMSPVSEKVETHLTGLDMPKTSSKKEAANQLSRSVRLNVRNLLIELGITIPMTLISFIPVVGLAATAFIFYIQSYYTGYGNMDYTLERHLNYKESKRFVRMNRGTAFGNGLVFTLLLFVPIVGIMLTLPISTVASTIDTVKKLQAEKVQ